MTRTSALALVLLVSGCVSTGGKDYGRLVSASPRSILIIPAVNKTVDVDAAGKAIYRQRVFVESELKTIEVH